MYMFQNLPESKFSVALVFSLCCHLQFYGFFIEFFVKFLTLTHLPFIATCYFSRILNLEVVYNIHWIA